jgi:hypothetical protein
VKPASAVTTAGSYHCSQYWGQHPSSLIDTAKHQVGKLPWQNLVTGSRYCAELAWDFLVQAAGYHLSGSHDRYPGRGRLLPVPTPDGVSAAVSGVSSTLTG